jgi:hypothetical protein
MKHGGFWYVARPVGYVYAFCNVATWSAARVPLAQAPLVTAWLSFAVIAAIVWAALWLPSELLANVAAKIAAAILLVVGPLAVAVVWLNASNAQTYLGVLTVLLLFVDVSAVGRGTFVAIAALLALAGLSGLYAAALAPLFVYRAIRERGRRHVALAGIMTVCALVQLIVVQVSRASGDLAQGRLTFPGFGAIARGVSAWHFGSLLFGTSIAAGLHTEPAVVVGLFAAVVGVVLLSLLAAVPNAQVAALLIAAFALEECLVIFGSRNGAGGRYAAVPIAILLLMAVHAMATARLRWASAIAAAMCLAALVVGCSQFWTRDTRVLRCQHCPDWQQQVTSWQAGRTDVLVIWPYSRSWKIVLPHAASGPRTKPADREARLSAETIQRR